MSSAPPQAKPAAQQAAGSAVTFAVSASGGDAAAAATGPILIQVHWLLLLLPGAGRGCRVGPAHCSMRSLLHAAASPAHAHPHHTTPLRTSVQPGMDPNPLCTQLPVFDLSTFLNAPDKDAPEVQRLCAALAACLQASSAVVVSPPAPPALRLLAARRVCVRPALLRLWGCRLL